MNWLQRITLIFIAACFSLALSAQGKWEYSAFVGASNYHGDLTPSNIVSSQTHLAYGGAATWYLRPSWSFRINFLRGKISGDGANFPHGSVQRKDGLSFENQISDLSFLFQWEPLGLRRAAKRRFSSGLSPYVFAGNSMLFHKPTVFFDVEKLDAETISQIRADQNAKLVSPNMTVAAGLGLKIYVSKKLTLGFEASAKPALTDYLDGISKAGEQADKDWLFFGGFTASYLLQSAENERKARAYAIAKTKRGKPAAKVPMEKKKVLAADEKMDTDGDAVPDKADECPHTAGHILHNGCPDSDLDGIRDNEDECPNLAGPKNLKGCPAEPVKEEVAEPKNQSDATKLAAKPVGIAQPKPQSLTVQKMPLQAAGIIKPAPAPPARTEAQPAQIEIAKVQPAAEPKMKTHVPAEAAPTPAGQRLKLEKEDVMVFDHAGRNVRFDAFGEKIHKDDGYLVDNIAAVMKRYPEAIFVIEGFSDSELEESRNIVQSQKRANSCRELLVKRGVKPDKIVALGKGSARPDKSENRQSLLIRLQ